MKPGRNHVWILVLISIAHFGLCVLSGALGWDWQTMIVSITSAVSMYFVYRMTKKMWLAFVVILPFFLVYIPVSILSKNPLNYPVWMGGVFFSLVAYIMINFKARIISFIATILVLALLEYFFVYPNYFSYQTMDSDTKKYALLNSKIVDINNKEISLEEFKGKVILFDVWHSACYWCIKQFPEVQELYDQYKSDSLVRIISLNYPIDRDSGIKQTRFTDKYTFDKMYFVSREDYVKMSGEGIPRTLIMDKNFNCRYAGQLNTEWNVFIGNAKRIINRLKNE